MTMQIQDVRESGHVRCMYTTTIMMVIQSTESVQQWDVPYFQKIITTETVSTLCLWQDRAQT